MDEPVGRGHGRKQQAHISVQAVKAVGGLAKESEEHEGCPGGGKRQMDASALHSLAAGAGPGDSATDRCNGLLPGVA